MLLQDNGSNDNGMGDHSENGSEAEGQNEPIRGQLLNKPKQT